MTRRIGAISVRICVIGVAVIGVAACSDQRAADDSTSRDIDFALNTPGRSNAIASQIEVGALPKPRAQTPAAPYHSHVRAAIAEASKAADTEVGAVPEPAPAAPVESVESVESVRPEPEPTKTAEVQPDPQPAPARTGHGGWINVPRDIGARIPGGGGNGDMGGVGGMGGGVIIIRGGGNGTDPCDERDHPRRNGNGGIGTILGGLPGRIGGGRMPGGIFR